MIHLFKIKWIIPKLGDLHKHRRYQLLELGKWGKSPLFNSCLAFLPLICSYLMLRDFFRSSLHLKFMLSKRLCKWAASSEPSRDLRTFWPFSSRLWYISVWASISPWRSYEAAGRRTCAELPNKRDQLNMSLEKCKTWFVQKTFELGKLIRRCSPNLLFLVHHLFMLLCRLEVGILLGTINLFLAIINWNIIYRQLYKFLKLSLLVHRQKRVFHGSDMS